VTEPNNLELSIRTAQLAGAAVAESVAKALAKYRDLAAPDGKRFFFPFGIQRISVDLKLPGGVEVNIQVGGSVPDPGSKVA
jgi:hypothetical protein